MSSDMVSEKTIHEFFVWMKDNWVKRTIKLAFDDADIIEGELPLGFSHSSVRYLLASSYRATLDLTTWPDVLKLTQVFESILQEVDDQIEAVARHDHEALRHDALTMERTRLLRVLKRDGFSYENGSIVSAVGAPILTTLDDIAQAFDLNLLRRQIRRIADNVEKDPDFAIGSSKELLETTCKTILGHRGISIEKKWDLSQLVKAARKELGLLPDDISDSVKGARSIKKLLGALATVAQGIAEVRNLYGTGHGKEGSSRSLPPRHARLIAGSATALASFLFETHEERN